MTRLRLARLAGELVALIYYSRRCDTTGLFGQAVCFIRSGISPARADSGNSRPDPRIVCCVLKTDLFQTEGQIQLHAAHIGVMDYDLLAEFTLALGAFALEQVASSGFRPNDLTGGGNLEALCHGLLGFAACDGFWHGAWTITEKIALGKWKNGGSEK